MTGRSTRSGRIIPKQIISVSTRCRSRSDSARTSPYISDTLCGKISHRFPTMDQIAVRLGRKERVIPPQPLHRAPCCSIPLNAKCPCLHQPGTRT
ncbi:hypothetical protein GOODEAATRI_025184 [Goodea atripinnis]|uniref:Uncharacterized protein n=1 Tax=Goodea atripinnis TaxID=208336 RepID=A0ABV0NDG3_9TELE